MRTSSAAQKPLLLVLAAAPAVYLAIAIYRYAVDIPVADEWVLARMFFRLVRGELTLPELFAQQNETRQYFPNLVFMGVGWFTKWDVRYEIALSVLTSCVIAFDVYRLASLSGFSTNERLWLFVAANLLIFSPLPTENWSQGQQLNYFVPGACLTTSLRIACERRLREPFRWLACAALSMVSTFSSAHGFVCWPLVGPALVDTSHRFDRRTGFYVVSWLFGFAVSLALYLYGYQKPAYHPPTSYVLVHPLTGLAYFSTLLSGPLGWNRLKLRIAAGVLLLALYLLALRIHLASRGNEERASASSCWLLMGGYAIVTAALITIGRGGFGLAQALGTMRYVTFTLFLPLALIHLLPRPGRRAAAWTAAMVLVLQLPLYVLGIRDMSAMRVANLNFKACVHFAKVVASECPYPGFPPTAPIRRLAGWVDTIGFLRPPLAVTANVTALADPTALAPERYGSFDALELAGDGQYTASGSARLPDRGEPADAVILAAATRDAGPTVFAVADMERHRDIVSALFLNGVRDDPRWRKTFSSRSLPEGTTMITAWAFDALSGKAYRLAGARALSAQKLLDQQLVR